MRDQVTVQGRVRFPSIEEYRVRNGTRSGRGSRVLASSVRVIQSAPVLEAHMLRNKVYSVVTRGGEELVT